MLYDLPKEQTDKLSKLYHLSEFINTEMLLAMFKTDMDVVKAILPRPLLPPEKAMAGAFVARYPETNFGCVYNEGALFVLCQYRGEIGLYCLSMPVDDDTALVSGRESFGYPKKMADKITLEKDDKHVFGSVVRKNVEILRIEGTLGEEDNGSIFGSFAKSTTDWNGVPCYRVLSFLFKYFFSPSGTSFDYFPRLVREPVLFRPQGKIVGVSGKVALSSTPFDPLGEVPVGDIVNILYGKWHNTMIPGKVVARVWNPLKFLKHAFFKADLLPVLLSNYDPQLTAKAKEIMKIARRF
jgi:acetoacetate decarboxylase